MAQQIRDTDYNLLLGWRVKVQRDEFGTLLRIRIFEDAEDVLDPKDQFVRALLAHGRALLDIDRLIAAAQAHDPPDGVVVPDLQTLAEDIYQQARDLVIAYRNEP